jgi:hypothetical protein
MVRRVRSGEWYVVRENPRLSGLSLFLRKSRVNR